jgi:hypothetical protein
VPILSPLQAITDEDKAHSLSFCVFRRTSVTRKATLIKRMGDGPRVPDPKKMSAKTPTKSTDTKLFILDLNSSKQSS